MPSSSSSPPSQQHPHLHYRQATLSDLPTIHSMESSSYPSDEAASLSSLSYRITNAPTYFLVATMTTDDTTTIVGYICATLCSEFTHDSMSTHDPTSATLAVHSVVTHEWHRRKGIATALMTHYLAILQKKQRQIKKVVLLAKAPLLGFYVSCGFSVLRPSDIVHGKEVWFHLELDLRLKCFVVDSFARGENFDGSGNPAGVVLMNDYSNVAENEEDEKREWLMKVAKELNHSETAFVWKREADAIFDIRYYTKGGIEVDLCGHATLAAAAVLFGEGNYGGEQPLLTFHATSHVLTASRYNDDGDDVKADNVFRISMDFPWKGVTCISDITLRDTIYPHLHTALKITPEDCLFLGVGTDGEDLFVELTPSSFHSLPRDEDAIDVAALRTCPGHSRGVIVCCRNDDEGVDFLSRFFGPKAGILEDPVTGSAHCLLAPYFYEKKKIAAEGDNKQELIKTNNIVVGRQMSQRGGIVRCVLKETEEGRGVGIAGTAVRVISCVLDV